MVARRLSYQHKSGTGYAQEFLHCFSHGFQKVPPFIAKKLKIKRSTFSTPLRIQNLISTPMTPTTKTPEKTVRDRPDTRLLCKIAN